MTDRKVAKERDKEKRREALARQRTAMVTGDDAGLPARDKGPERRYIRDYIDARWSVGEIVLPIMIIVLALSFLRTSWALMTVFFLTYGLIAVGDHRRVAHVAADQDAARRQVRRRPRASGRR